MLGATVGGALGAVIGAVGGTAAGLYRDVTGRSALEGWLMLSYEEKSAILRSAGFAARSQDPEAATSSSPSSLSAVELQALDAAPANDGEPLCLLCCVNAVNVVFQPCGHAQVDSPSLLSLLPRSATIFSPTSSPPPHSRPLAPTCAYETLL